MGLSILGPAAWVNAIAGIAVFFVFIYIVRRRKSKTEAGIRPLSTRRLAMAQQGKGGTPAKPLSVCIIGGGISGCGSAAFLREMMAPGDLEISVLEAGSILGGRVGLVDFDGRKYEAGASVLHDVNVYSVSVAKQHKLKMKHRVTNGLTAVFYNGTGPEIVVSGPLSIIKLIYRFGILTLKKLGAGRDYAIEKFLSIYQTQANGVAFTTVAGLLSAVGGQSLSSLTMMSFRSYATTSACPEAHRLTTDVVDVLIAGGTRMNYGQTPDTLTAFAAMVSMAGTQTDKLFCIEGGNNQIAECLLKDSMPGTNVSFGKKPRIVTPATSGRWSVDGTVYDAVIIACPIGGMGNGGVQVQGYVPPPGSAAMHRTVATFIKGTISEAMLEKLGCADATRGVPGVVLTTRQAWEAGCPFNSIGLQFAVDMGASERKAYVQAAVGPLPRGQKRPPAVWKIFSNEPLSAEVLDSMFDSPEGYSGGWAQAQAGTGSIGSPIKSVDWLAYPEYSDDIKDFPPLSIGKGLAYTCAIEKAASSVEMALIGAKNAANLVSQHFVDTGKAAVLA